MDDEKKSDRDQIRAILDDGFRGRITPEVAADRLAAFGVTGINIVSATVTVDGRVLTPDEAEDYLATADRPGNGQADPL